MEPYFPIIAAVAGIVVREPATEVLVLKRRANPRDPWSGHYSFPGGRREPNDATLFDTCVRETYEECGIVLAHDRLVKQYPMRTAGNSLDRPVSVAAYLFELDRPPDIRLQVSEISCYEWVALDYAGAEENIVWRVMSPRYPDRLFPCLPATDGLVWGFTYETLQMIIADRYHQAPASAATPPEGRSRTKSA